MLQYVPYVRHSYQIVQFVTVRHYVQHVHHQFLSSTPPQMLVNVLLIHFLFLPIIYAHHILGVLTHIYTQILLCVMFVIHQNISIWKQAHLNANVFNITHSQELIVWTHVEMVSILLETVPRIVMMATCLVAMDAVQLVQ